MNAAITIERCHIHLGPAKHFLAEDVLWPPGADRIEALGGRVTLRRDPNNERQWLLVAIDGASVGPTNEPEDES